MLGGSARQAACPPELIGRMSATSRTLTWGVIPLGALLGGAAGSLVGTRAALVAVGVAYAVPLLLALASPLRSVRDLESAEIRVPAPR